MRQAFLINMLMAIAWVLLTADLNFINFLEGFLIAYIILFFVKDTLNSQSYYSKLPKIIFFIFYFLKELFMANLYLAYDILTPKDRMTPGFVIIDLDAKTNLEITLLSSLITLTPGTLSLDVSPDRKQLYIHSVYIKDLETFKQSIKEGFEKRILEILR